MKFQVETLIDITETGARKGTGDKKAYNQHQNFLTLIQTIGLRVNISAVGPPVLAKKSAKEFGTKYKGQHNVWTYEFDIEYESALSLEMLVEDFDLVPIILGLSETADINNSVFRTKDAAETNILFKLAD